MAMQVRIDFQSDGFRELMNQPAVRQLITEGAEKIAAAAGDGFDVQSYRADFGGSPRPMSVVRANSWEARRAEAENQALTRAVRGGA